MKIQTVDTALIRKPAAAGLFYPSNAQKLQKDVDAMLSRVVKAPISANTLNGLIVPHAGYLYSGAVAAEAFANIRKETVKTVIILSPSHRDYFQSVSVYRGGYETPLGIVKCDQKMIDELLLATNCIQETELGHREEHGVEVELPFLQRKLGQFELVPLVMGSQTWENITSAAEAIANCANSQTLVIASSDLSHFYSQQRAQELDQILINHLENFDTNALYDDVQNRRCEACGYGPILTTMIACKKSGATSAKVISYQTSGDVSGDYSEVVGYLAGLIYS